MDDLLPSGVVTPKAKLSKTQVITGMTNTAEAAMYLITAYERDMAATDSLLQDLTQELAHLQWRADSLSEQNAISSSNEKLKQHEDWKKEMQKNEALRLELIAAYEQIEALKKQNVNNDAWAAQLHQLETQLNQASVTLQAVLKTLVNEYRALSLHASQYKKSYTQPQQEAMAKHINNQKLQIDALRNLISSLQRRSFNT